MKSTIEKGLKCKYCSSPMSIEADAFGGCRCGPGSVYCYCSPVGFVAYWICTNRKTCPAVQREEKRKYSRWNHDENPSNREPAVEIFNNYGAANWLTKLFNKYPDLVNFSPYNDE